MSSNLTQWSALVGFLLPVVVAFVQRQHWPQHLRIAVGIAACAIAAAVTAYFEGKLNLHNWSQSVVVIFLLTKTSYMAVWKPSGVTGNIEAKASPRAP